MKNLILLLAAVLIGCESPKNETIDLGIVSPVPDAPIDPEICTAMEGYELISDNSGTEIGYFLEHNSGFDWYRAKCSDNYFGVDSSGNLRKSNALIFDDEGCQNVIGEVFNYPLHYSGDVYTFAFENELYIYELGPEPDFVQLNGYYSKTEFGSCIYSSNFIDGVRVVKKVDLDLPFSFDIL